ncbi:MAG: hypothetical protein AYK18_09435 [Theionarchaea archaeon DG-70]|nr:MAG: hypothetical protein AYK18_09435 [Theionarchaea archaeon DG-70]
MIHNPEAQYRKLFYCHTQLEKAILINVSSTKNHICGELFQLIYISCACSLGPIRGDGSTE